MLKCILLICLLLITVYTDLKSSKIKNVYVFSAAFLGIFINIFYNGFFGLELSVKGIVFPILSLGIFFYARLIGAGDVKLFCSIGALFGLNFVFFTMAYAFIIAGVFAIIFLVMKTHIKSIALVFYKNIKICLLTNSLNPLQYKSTKYTIRLAPAIAMGAILHLITNNGCNMLFSH